MKKTSILLCVGLTTACLAVVAVSRATGGRRGPRTSEAAAPVLPQRAGVTPYTLVQRQTYTPVGGPTLM